MRTTNFKVADDLYLVHVALDAAATPTAPKAVHHIAVIDVSRSMEGDLPELRRQLKRKLPKLIAEGDTLSVVAFSGRGQCYVVLEAEPVATIADLSEIERAIDRWIKPVGMTGFREPLEAVWSLADSIKLTPRLREGSISLFFMTDGCDNQWPREQIMRALDEVAEHVSSITIVEYGYHADRPMLIKMAEQCGGVLLFAEDFDRYQPTFEAEMARRPNASPPRRVTFEGAPIGKFVWTQEENELRTHEAPVGTTSLLNPEAEHYACVFLPEHVKEFFYLSERAQGASPQFAGGGDGFIGVDRRTAAEGAEQLRRACYAALSLFATRMRPDIIYPILRHLGDVRLIDMFAGCFGKQQYSYFMEAAREAAFDPAQRCASGYDPGRVPADDAFTLLELMQILEEDGARVLLDHPDWDYERITQKRVDACELLTLDEQARVSALNALICGERNIRKVRELQAEVEKILSSKPEPLRFVPNKKYVWEGYPIASLTWNEDRPNLSFKVRTEGTVDLSGRIPPELAGNVPNPFPTFQYRDRAIVRDGIVHLAALPVRMSERCARLLAQKLPVGARSKKVVVGNGWVEGIIYPKRLPVLNRRMVGMTNPGSCPTSALSAERLFRLQFKLEQARAAQKVYKALRDEVVPKKGSPSFRELYGEQAAGWLREQGFTEYSGFEPRRETINGGDYYLGRVLEVKLRSYSSLPSIDEYRRQVAELESGKRKSLTPAARLMQPYMDEARTASHAFFEDNTEEAARDAFAGWIRDQSDSAVAVARQLLREIAQIKFAVIVGQVWFEEFRSLDENSMEFDEGGVRIQGKIELREVQVKV